MTAIEIRPRFRKKTRLNVGETLQCFRLALDNPQAKIKGYIVDHHVILKIPVEDQHYWSPQLSLEVEEASDGALIRGLYGPKPSVWLMFIFFYAALGFVSLVVMVMGFSQLNLNLSGRILWLLPIAAILFIMVYLSAKAGQKKGHDQMETLHHFFEEALNGKGEKGE